MTLRRRPSATAFATAIALFASGAALAGPVPQFLRIQAQAPGGDSARLAVAGRRLSVHAAPRGGSPVVAHVERGDQVIVVDTQLDWAKIEDYQTGRLLGWVANAMLVDPGG